MKKILLSVSFFVLLTVAVQAQCGKSITWSSSKTEYLDASGALQRIENSPVTILTTPNHITVTFKTGDGQSDVIEGDLENLQCNWKEAFKSGKTSFKSLLAKSNGETKNATISIEGTEGKLTIIVELENMKGMKMRIPVDGYKVND
jgi:hypothetical protein